jgi:hypothetical protein
LYSNQIPINLPPIYGRMKFIVVASKDCPTILRFKGDDHNDAIFFRVWRMIRPNRKGYGAIVRIVTLSRTHLVSEIKMASEVRRDDALHNSKHRGMKRFRLLALHYFTR